MKHVGCKGWVVVRARGHMGVRATHGSTFEITKEEYLTERGDCIIGVASDTAASDLPEWFKSSARNFNSIIVAVLCSGGICDSVVGRGSPSMSFSDNKRLVFRKSGYVGPDTVMILASKAANDLDRRLISNLARRGGLTVLMTVIEEA